MIKAVLFDMDGVLADSEQLISRAAAMMFGELGIKVEQHDFKPFTGTGENRYIGGVAEKYNISIDIEKAKARTYEIYMKIIRGKLKPHPGAAALVSRCRETGLKLALVTSSDRIKTEATLAEIGISPGSFDAVITGSDVKNKKPFPDIYLEAARRTGYTPGECLVIEDAPSGIKAAKSAGCRCLAVTTTFEKSLLAGADWICDTLENIPEEVLKW